MNNKIFGSVEEDPKKEICDVLILGTGVSGLYSSLNIDSKYQIILISKTTLDQNNSSLAQGGIAACIDEHDDFFSHYEDTLRAGAYYNREETTKVLIKEAPNNIEKLLEYGVMFDRDEFGHLKVTKEGGHSKRRIVHVKDATGKEVIRALGEEVKKRKNIKLYENTFAVKLFTYEGKVCGVLAIKDNQKVIYQSKVVILATGGAGQVYKNTTNPHTATGDGIAMAVNVGAKIKDMEFIQFHPTALYDQYHDQKFLISEAVRGEGAILRNIKGEAFMKKYHPMKDLAPRDIVARSIFIEKEKTKKSHVYLDITHKSSDFIKERFPTIYNRCLEDGIDMTKEYIPVSPVQHYTMGGIDTDVNGKTNIDRLYACGECACSGVHGANRLASNSLLEGIVFGKRVADHIHKTIDSLDLLPIHIEQEQKGCRIKNNIDTQKIKERIKKMMDAKVFIMRNEKDLLYAHKEIEKIENIIKDQTSTIDEYECMNLCIVAKLIIDASLKRTKSIGAHYRIDEEGRNCIINF
ncbi:L-aspartate oxidase [Inediibacterium massiliense]|uniref:L-aspartate oxidase n=1 Tax=Inediibacterium massiliense TaxID=1658111 RepID=UPI0006B3FBB8|nr:L-aspartate oxidase [Inediibacterium massiliense]